jgi:hypothetical protein
MMPIQKMPKLMLAVRPLDFSAEENPGGLKSIERFAAIKISKFLFLRLFRIF